MAEDKGLLGKVMDIVKGDDDKEQGKNDEQLQGSDQNSSVRLTRSGFDVPGATVGVDPKTAPTGISQEESKSTSDPSTGGEIGPNGEPLPF